MNEFEGKGPNCCVLCGGVIAILGVFYPPPWMSKRIGEPSGKKRVVFYGLCANCFTPDQQEKMEEKVETKLLSMLTVQ
jgi:hypothetical protein